MNEDEDWYKFTSPNWTASLYRYGTLELAMRHINFLNKVYPNHKWTAKLAEHEKGNREITRANSFSYHLFHYENYGV